MAADSGPAASVVIPAHNEEHGIRRLLDALACVPPERPLRVIVVANGCTDGTVDVVRGRGDIELIELAEGNKQKAMRAGAAVVTDFPIVYSDADVVVTADAVRDLAAALRSPDLLAVAPRRQLDLAGAAASVESYYRIWAALPQVRDGLSGRGVIALSEAGQRRVEHLPMYLSDDLALSESFRADERAVVDAALVTIVCPRRARDLVRRRQRVIQGTREFDAGATHESRQRTSVGGLLRLIRDEPRLAVHLPAFLGVTIAARVALRLRRVRGTEQAWLRDESSRRD